ncbi:ATP-dependent zinc metalloprotease FtsH [Persicitalea jodogahamensis]|uniref:ATP-dependent zinc metalloprotease FtsH n=1 Tax=Persicitalea jodogahamensis TaxID=402147 RepID=A0A8J3G7L1_9BACT|nr:ATP-dependent zinc metalloprotease FtsH [Persicitalea jodogahamensis]GHB56405.1 ATP-dependent zinc metalloprotease FtsH [Persicitalea jodogahamensis]
MSDNDNKRNPLNPKSPQRGYQGWIIAALIATILGITYLNKSTTLRDISQKRFEKMVADKEVARVTIVNDNKVEVSLKPEALRKDKYQVIAKENNYFGGEAAPHYQFQITSAETFKKDLEKIQEGIPDGEKIEYKIEARGDWSSWIGTWGFFIVMIVVMYFLLGRMSGGVGPGGQLFNIGRSRATLFDAENKVKITFNDVAGLDEAKEEIKEIVDYLKSPDKFKKLGAKIPKGALLVGPPGTGKTLLAKAVAGEAEVPFFSLSGSDFVEMFVGVGAARVRDLFKQAKEKAPCIIFIDEIDAVGRSRGRGGMPGSNDERENTLNSLLVEMDGFATDSGIIIVAATNRPDVLDSALLRPGRFDRQISVDKPDVIGREAIFKVHLKPIKISEDVDIQKLAAQTPGFAGAEIANVCNEAALIAARRDRESVTMQDFQDAMDRVIGGLEKKNKLISPEEKQIVAYHEAGHAVAGWYLEHADPLVKVTIVPRGVAALGYAQYLPREQYLYRTEQLFDEMCMTLGGRAAEDVVFGKISTGALSDLERVTKVAYSMVTMYGMNDKIGNISFYDSKQSDYNFTKPYSENTAEKIDHEVRLLVDKAYQHVLTMLRDKREQLEIIAQELLEKEILFQSDLETLIGKRPYEKETNYQAYVNRRSREEAAVHEEAVKHAEEEKRLEEKEDSDAVVVEAEVVDPTVEPKA